MSSILRARPITGLSALFLILVVFLLGTASFDQVAAQPSFQSTPTPSESSSIRLEQHLVFTEGSTSSEIFPRIDLLWSPEGFWLALVNGQADNGLMVFDARTGENVHMVRDERMTVADWAPDRPLLAVGTERGVVNAWEPGQATNESERLLFNAEIGQIGIYGLSWLPDGDQLLISGTAQRLVIVEVPSGTVNEVFPLANREEQPLTAALSPNEQYIAAHDGRGRIVLLERITGAQVHAWEVETPIARLRWSPDSRLLAAVSPARGPRIWDISNGEEISLTETIASTERTPVQVADVAWSPDANWLAVAGLDVSIYDVQSGQKLAAVTVNNVPQLGITWDPTGTFIASYNARQEGIIWLVINESDPMSN